MVYPANEMNKEFISWKYTSPCCIITLYLKSFSFNWHKVHLLHRNDAGSM